MPVLVQYVIDGECILQDFGEDGVSCLSKEDFDTLATGEEEANIGVNLHVSALGLLLSWTEEISTFFGLH